MNDSRFLRFLPRLTVVGLAWLALFPITSVDAYYHLATGRRILDSGAIPRVGVGSATFADHPWHDNEWGFQVVAATLARFGRVDILVQNAGIYPMTMIADIDPTEWDRVLAVNLKGVFLAFQACLATMQAQRYGRCIFTSSITGPRVTSPGHGHYSATKAGINGFIRSAALEFSAYGITVNGVEPGNIMTEAVKLQRGPEFIRSMEESIPLGRLGTPLDVANAFLFLASDEAGYITGTTIVVDGGQLLPEGRDFRILPP